MAKSPTPIPAPPVKIQRDTNGAAPAAPATKPKKAAPQKRRKRRRNPLLWFLHGLIRRIYFGLKTASRLVLLAKMDDATASSALAGFTAKLNAIADPMRKSFTYDQGKEMSYHRQLAAATGVRV